MSQLPSVCSRALKLRTFFVVAIFLLSSLSVGVVSTAQESDPDRVKAFQLFAQGKYKEAQPLFDKLEKAYPNDPAILERAGWISFYLNDSIKDPAERRAARRRGRELLVRARSAGSESPVVASMIDAIPADGGDDTAFSFSKRKEVDDAMRAGESAFMKKDFPKAIEYYQQALLLEPTLYEAALFIGDSYFSSADQRKASEWFAKAVEIDPNRETAYRYWGDALMKQARVTEAGDKFVEAYIAEPYSRLSNSGLVNWASKVGVQLAHPKIDFSADVSAQQNGSSTLTLDPNAIKKDDKSTQAWMMYGITRASWVQKEFKQQYPGETEYRHSLGEEVAAIKAALGQISAEKDPAKLDPSLVALAKLDKEGLLESYVLLARVDAGIAKDFKAYRKDHVAKLREYVNKYVLTNGGKN